MPSKKGKSYLRRLPDHAQLIGSAANGEAEIATSRRDVIRVTRECGDSLKGSALGTHGKRLGILLEDEVRMVVRDPLIYPGGVSKCEMRVIGKTEYDGVNGVAVLAMCDGRFVLREIFRHATRSWELETTRGRRETGQTAEQAARAEVKQELGYRVRRLKRLGHMCPDSALMSSVIDLFFAELHPQRDSDDPDEGEAFGRILHFSPRQLAQRIKTGKIRDSYVLALLTLAQLRGVIPPVKA